jgi:hypothetical protein
MNTVILFALVTLALLGALYWLSRRASSNRGAASLPQALSAEKLLPQNYKYFPQIRQALSRDDDLFLEKRAGPEIARMARKVRRSTALQFLKGLRDDYRRLDRLARTLTALAPAPDRQRETERIWLSIRFEVFWGVVWLRVWIGSAPIGQLQLLSELIGTQAVRLARSMDALHEAATSQPA